MDEELNFYEIRILALAFSTMKKTVSLARFEVALLQSD
jgi:hypothetical protein